MDGAHTKTDYERAFERIPLRNPATVVVMDSDRQLMKLQAWTDDISPAGTRLQTLSPLPTEEISFRVLMDGIHDKVFNGRIVRAGKTEEWRNKQEVVRYEYGIAIHSLCDDPAILALLQPSVER